MSYSSNISEIDNGVTDVNNDLSSLRKVDFSESWYGPAHINLTGKVSVLDENLNTQKNYASKIAEAMEYIDKYDDYVDKENLTLDRINRLDQNDLTKTYYLSSLYSQLGSYRQAKKNAKESAKNALSGITKSYESQYEKIEFSDSDIVLSGEIFADILSGNDGITSCLDLNNVVSSSSDGSLLYKEDPDSTASVGDTINLPDGLGSAFTYMGWQCITSPSSAQYKLREDAGMNFNDEGFGVINNRYVVATTSTYGNVGDYIDVKQSDGTVIPCVIGDIKSQGDAGCNTYGHNNGQNVVEFVVDKDSWYNCGHGNPGTSSCMPELGGKTIVSVTNVGNYYD